MFDEMPKLRFLFEEISTRIRQLGRLEKDFLQEGKEQAALVAKAQKVELERFQDVMAETLM